MAASSSQTCSSRRSGHSRTKWGSGWLCTLHQPSTSVTDDMMACGTPAHAAAAWRLSSAAASTAADAPLAALTPANDSALSCPRGPPRWYSGVPSASPPAALPPLPAWLATGRPAAPPSTPVGVERPLVLGALSGMDADREREVRESPWEVLAEPGAPAAPPPAASQKARAAAGSGR